jgi:hypothetical protein
MALKDLETQTVTEAKASERKKRRDVAIHDHRTGKESFGVGYTWQRAVVAPQLGVTHEKL